MDDVILFLMEQPLETVFIGICVAIIAATINHHMKR